MSHGFLQYLNLKACQNSFKQTLRGSCHVPPISPKKSPKKNRVFYVEDFPHHHSVSPFRKVRVENKTTQKKDMMVFPKNGGGRPK